MGWMAPFEWTSQKLYSGAGYVASWVGAEDTAEFLWSAGNPAYVEKSYRTKTYDDATKTMASQEERDHQKKEANRYTKAAVEEIAPAVETTLVTTGQVGATVGTAYLSRSPLWSLGAFQATENVFDAYLEANGEKAPVRSLRRVYSPLAETGLPGLLDFGGDSHYRNGGTIDEHPKHLEGRKTHEGKASPPSPNTDNNKSSGFLAMLETKTGLKFGAGSIIGIILGALAMFINPIVGGVILAGGLLFGQKAMDSFASSGKENPETKPNISEKPKENPKKAEDKKEDKKPVRHSLDEYANLVPPYTPPVSAPNMEMAKAKE